MEQWDIYNKSGEKTGRTARRGMVNLQKGEYHLVVHIWVLGFDGRVLIQRRSDNKPLMPGEWAATGGAAISGETSKEAAQRELNEELGIFCENPQFIKRIYRRNSFVDIYLVRYDAPASELTLQTEEVAEARWVQQNKLRSMIKNGKYHNYGRLYWNIIFNAFHCCSKHQKRKHK